MHVIHSSGSCCFWRYFILKLSSVRKNHVQSVLYLTGDKANKTVSVLTPHLDFNDRFKDVTKLERNVNLRCIKIDVPKLREQWEVLETVVAEKTLLENKRVEIAEKVKESTRTGNILDIQKFQMQGRLVRDNLKSLMKTLWSLEENIVIKALNLPNDLHPDTPMDDKVIYQFGSTGKISKLNHLDIGRQMSVVEYLHPSCYYFKGDGVVCELAILKYFSQELQKNHFTRFSNMDFVCSIIAEGCGLQYYNPEKLFILNDEMDHSKPCNRLHLVGGSSLFSFCAFHAKHVIPEGALPLKYFAVGKQYNPTSKLNKQVGLFDVWQSSSIEIFILTTNDDGNVLLEFNNTLDIVIQLYQELGFHFQVVYQPPKKLKLWESLRASIQMYSAYLQSYVEVGHLSLIGCYISKRLLMYYEHEQSKCEFVHVLSGNILSIPKIMGCILESEQCRNNSLTIPHKIKMSLV